MEMHTPWGMVNSTAKNAATETIKTVLRQLESYKNDGRGSKGIFNDIEGYKMILDSEDPEKNAMAFLDMKKEIKENGIHWDDNLKVVKNLIILGRWT